jgi:hypothetical protein
MLRAFVLLVAAHSMAVGGALVLAPDWATGLAGLGPVRPIFFARQAGVFHLVLAAGYLLELRRGGVSLLVLAKSAAAVFLAASALAATTAWAVPVSALADALMGAGAAWLHRPARAGGRR